MSFMSSLNRQNNENAPVLDPSDLNHFPTLGNRASLSSSNATPMSKPGYDWRANWNTPRQRPQEAQPDFTIQPEDFPALPGAQNPPTSTATENGRKSPSSGANFGPYEQAVRDSRQQQNLGNNSQKRGLQTLPDGTVTNIPPGMVSDQFGMAGLLTFIQTAETDHNLVALNPGIDLMTLGLNLHTYDTLYSTFQSPWADTPCRSQDIDFHVPSEYLTNMFIREKLAPIKLNRYGDDLLFYLFYMNGNDVLQLAAAAELYNRDWRCHKDERVWITRPQGMEPVVKTNTYERGTYYFFDVNTWRRVAKEFHLEYEKLEERPHLPANVPPTPVINPQQQQQAPPPQQHLLHNAVQQQQQGPLSSHS
jgi:CCR4-NOT transcription complex subunit 2